MVSVGSKKHILIIVENLPVPFDRRVWQEAESLTKNGYKVSVICPRMKGFTKHFEIINDIKIYRHPLPYGAKSGLSYLIEYGIALFYEFYYAIKIYLNDRFDAIHACNPPDDIFFIGLFFRFFGVKFVFDHHDLCLEAFETKFKKKGYYYYILKFLEKGTFKFADYVIATNESYKRVAIKRGCMKPAKVFIVRSAPDKDRFQRMKKYQKKKKFLVAYLGVMGKSDGLNYLSEAIDYIINFKKINDIEFVLVGDGTEKQNIEKYILGKNLTNFVDLPGRIACDEVAGILSESDVCVNPDEYNAFNDKSTMNKIMEYMYFSKPIVQFDMKEGKYSAQKASLYATKNDSIDFAEKIIQLINNPSMSKKMGAFGKKRFESELPWKKSEKNLLRLYNTLFSNG